MTIALDPDGLLTVLVRAFPELAGSVFVIHEQGWDSVAVDVDDRLIFKFPRHEAARERLQREVALLGIIRSRVSLPTPDIRLHVGPPLFSRHEKLRGGYLEPAAYAGLSDGARDRLADALAGFYAELHAVPAAPLKLAGAGPIGPWLRPDEILPKVWPVLSEALRAYAERTVGAWRDLAPDPHAETFGFFDGHGWNMAFDADAGRLNGVYDFGDSGFGPRHQEFIYSHMISPDLTWRIVARYEALTGLAFDRARIDLLFQYLRLSELAANMGDAKHEAGSLAEVLRLGAG